MLWSPAILLLLAGAAFAGPQNGWKNGKEYTYKIRSRTVAAFNPQSKQYTGILMEARLTVQPNGDDTLRAKITQPRYSQIHTRLEKGWDSEVPQNQLSMQTFFLSGKPFEIKTKNGVVRDLIVDKEVPTWEVNVLKSIVSQLQVDTNGENAEKSKHNQFPEGNQPNALYKVMEDSVGGMCEVLYDVSPLPEHVLQSNPELAPLPDLREGGDMISLVKSKNYSNCDQRVSYHFGLNGRNKWEPGSNDNGRYLSRSSVSRVVLSGNLKRYTIQSSVTTNKVVLNPDQQENQQGMVASRMNLTLHEVKDISEQVPPPSNPQTTGNLVYNYNNPSENSSSRRPNKFNHQKNHDKSSENRHSDESASDSSDSIDDNKEDSYLQQKPKLTEAPQNPMLPFFVGYKGNMIQKSNKINAVNSAKDIAKEIGNEMQNPDNMPESQTLEKFTILSRLIRTMNAEQIAEVQRDLYEQPQSANQLEQGNQGQNARRNAWVAFRDAVAQAGTGPALVNIKQWVQNKQIQGHEAASVIDATAKSARTPTKEYMDAFFEMVSLQETKKQRVVRDAAILSFADLIRHAIVNRQSAHNRYPVHAFGRLFSRDSNNVREKYIPYMSEELKNAVDTGDSKKIQVYVTALGRTAHPSMLSVFEPYLEGKKQVSPHQRLVMVLNLYKLTTSHPKLARSVLYKIYSNNGDHHEIRTAAVYLLIKTNPPASMLQRMAESTNHEVNKHVNSAVKSTIQSLAQLQDEENRELSNAARAAMPLLTSEKYGLRYSRAVFKSYKNSETHSGFTLSATYIGSDDSIIPKGGNLVITPIYRGLKVPKFQFGGAISSIQNTWKFVQRKFNSFQNENQNNQNSQQRKYSPENISKLLGIHGEEPEQIEGFVFLTQKNGDHFFAYDNHTLEQIPEEMKQLAKSMKKGVSYQDAKLSNYEVTMSFPMETGYPFTYSLKAPLIVSVDAQSKLKTDSEFNNEIPKLATASGKIRMVYGMKVQKRLGFVTPFEHQEYIAGVDKNFQVFVPFQSEIEYNKDQKEARIKFQPNEDEKDFRLLQFKTQPFTSKHDILNLHPVATDKNTHTVRMDEAKSSNIELNDNSNKQKLQFKWESQSEEQSEDNTNLDKETRALIAANSLVTSISSIYYPNLNERTDYEKYSVKLSPSSDMNVEVKVSYDTLVTENNSENSEDSSPNAKAPHLEQNLSQGGRKEKLLSTVAKNINAAKAGAVDVSVQVNGGLQTTLAITAAVGMSNVDPKSRALLYASVKTKDDQKFHFSAGFEGKNPNQETLDYEETLKSNPRHEFEAEFHYGMGSDESSNESHDEIKIHAKAKQSEEHKNFVRQSRDAQECNKEKNKSGNKLAPSCQRANKRAELVDSGEIIITFENNSPLKQSAMEAVDSLVSISVDHATVQKNRQEKQSENQIKLGYEMSPRDDKIDIYVKTPEGKVQFMDIKLSELTEHNVNTENKKDTEDIESSIIQPSTCYLDKTQAKSFDNHRYNIQLGNCWHVAMTSYPKNDPDRPSEQQSIPHDMHVTILTRENENGQKELKVTLGESEVELSNSGPQEPRAKVNGKKVDYSKYRSHLEKQGNKVAFEIFELPDKSIKLVSDKFAVSVIYDGSRAIIETGERYRDSVRGLCGNNDGEFSNDQQSPRGCLLQKSEEFSATYALTKEGQCEGPAVQNADKARSSQCSYEIARPGNVISDSEAGRTSEWGRNDDNDSRESRRCMTHRTKVVMKNDKICFSLRPVPTCSSSCSAQEVKSKDVQFHCVARSSASEKVAERIEKGANPDLSERSVTYTESYRVPLSCKA